MRDTLRSRLPHELRDGPFAWRKGWYGEKYETRNRHHWNDCQSDYRHLAGWKCPVRPLSARSLQATALWDACSFHPSTLQNERYFINLAWSNIDKPQT